MVAWTREFKKVETILLRASNNLLFNMFKLWEPITRIRYDNRLTTVYLCFYQNMTFSAPKNKYLGENIAY